MEHQVFAACSTGVRGEARCASAAGHADWAQLSAAADFERRAAALKSRREGLLLPGELRALEAEKEKARLAEERSARRAANASREAAEAEEEEKRKEVQAREAGRRRAWEAPELRELRRHYQEVEAEQLRQLQVLRKEVEEEARKEEEQASRAAHEVEFLAQERASAHLAAESRGRAVQLQKEGEAEAARKTCDQARRAAKEKYQDKMMVHAAVCQAQQQDLKTETRRRKLQAAVRAALDRLIMEQAQLQEQEVRDEKDADRRAQKQQSAMASFWAARAQERRAAEHARAQVLQRVAACLAQRQEDEERLQMLHGLLQEEAAAAALRREEELALQRRLQARTKAVQAAEDGLRNLCANRHRQQAEEAAWRSRFVESCAEEAKLEQLSDQKKRMRLLAFKREADELVAKRRELREAEAEKEESELHLQKLKEQEQSRILEEERRSLLAIHARGGLLDREWFSGAVLPKQLQDPGDS